MMCPFCPNWGWPNWGWGLMGGWGMLLVWLLLIGVVVLAVVALTRAAQGRPSHQSEAEAALAILRRRLAAGEITPQEFDELRHKLGV